MQTIDLKIKQLEHAQGLPLPEYKSFYASGMDLYAATSEHTPTFIYPWSTVIISTGICIELPVGFEAQIRSRSGLAAKDQVCVLNSPGTIDSDYRGEIQIILINHGREKFKILRGDRIAQMVIAPVAKAKIESVVYLSDTDRGSGGFGSTGT